MTCRTQAISTPAPSARGHRIRSFFKREWDAFWASRVQRATVHILHGLDDTTLRDIGLDRSEIESVVYGQPGQRRLRYDPR